MAKKSQRPIIIKLSTKLSAELTAQAKAVAATTPQKFGRQLMEVAVAATPSDVRGAVARLMSNALRRQAGKRPKFKF